MTLSRVCIVGPGVDQWGFFNGEHIKSSDLHTSGLDCAGFHVLAAVIMGRGWRRLRPFPIAGMRL